LLLKPQSLAFCFRTGPPQLEFTVLLQLLLSRLRCSLSRGLGPLSVNAIDWPIIETTSGKLTLLLHDSRIWRTGALGLDWLRLAHPDKAADTTRSCEHTCNCRIASDGVSSSADNGAAYIRGCGQRSVTCTGKRSAFLKGLP
jgi:hypothetical protein